MEWNIPKATAYGGVLLTRTGQILLREPANHFDNYVWTFAKGRPGYGDTPELTALREVLEETGYEAEIVDVLPGLFQGDTTSNAYFVMRHVGLQGKTDWETDRTRWVSFDEAAELICLTSNVKGRQRDLAILAAAKQWFCSNQTVVLPDAERDVSVPAKKEDWNTLPLPDLHVKLLLDFNLSEDEVTALKLGDIPSSMEDRWFVYFAENVLYQHRSWSGYCIDQVYFVPKGGGLRVTHALVNRDPEQYGLDDDNEDAQRIQVMVRDLVSRNQLP